MRHLQKMEALGRFSPAHPADRLAGHTTASEPAPFFNLRLPCDRATFAAGIGIDIGYGDAERNRNLLLFLPRSCRLTMHHFLIRDE